MVEATPGSEAPEPARKIDTGCGELLCSLEDGVARVTLHRPEARNAHTMDMKLALWALLPELDADPDVRCLLLTGSGAAFCAETLIMDGIVYHPQLQNTILSVANRDREDWHPVSVVHRPVQGIDEPLAAIIPSHRPALFSHDLVVRIATADFV